MLPKDPQGQAILFMIGAIALGSLLYAAVTWRGTPIDESCSFDFQCTTYDGFEAPRCSSWGVGSRCTLTCADACPAGMSCEPAELDLGTTTIPFAACHR